MSEIANFTLISGLNSLFSTPFNPCFYLCLKLYNVGKQNISQTANRAGWQTKQN